MEDRILEIAEEEDHILVVAADKLLEEVDKHLGAGRILDSVVDKARSKEDSLDQGSGMAHLGTCLEDRNQLPVDPHLGMAVPERKEEFHNENDVTNKASVYFFHTRHTHNHVRRHTPL